jgi:hypothetical protein
VINDVGLVNHLRQEVTVHHAIKETLQGAVRPQVAEIINGPGAQIVQDNNPVAAQKQGFRQMRPDESRPTCYQ